MKKYALLLIFTIILIAPSLLSAQGAICVEMKPFCTDTGASFLTSTNTQAEPDNQYGCLGTQPNPAWYYLEIVEPGYLEITITNSNFVDIDFIVYGPFADIQTAQERCGSFETQETSCPFSGVCPNGVPCSGFDDCVNGDGVDCSYNPQSTEVADIPNAQTGEVYVLLITNFSNQLSEMFVNKTGGTATTNCSIVECREVSFLQNTPNGLAPYVDSIFTNDAPIQLIATPGDIPVTDGFISPAFGIHITTDSTTASENSLEIYNEPNGEGELLAYWGYNDMGGTYLGEIPDNSDFIAFSEYVDPTASYSFVWCDAAQTGNFQYKVIDYAINDSLTSILAAGELDNNSQNCFTVNFNAPTGVATFTGEGVVDTGSGQAIFDPSGLEPGIYEITYSWDDGDNCSGSVTYTIEVKSIGVNINQPLYDDSIEVFPNPFNDKITVDVSRLPIPAERFVLYDVNGRVVKIFTLSYSLSNQYDVNELNSGLYFYEILNEGNELLGRGKLLK